MKNKILLLLIFLINAGLCQSQDFGGFSPNISWKQINTRPVRVIFPEGLEDQANRVANMISYLDQNNRTTIGDKFKKIDLVMNNQGIIPNGYVTLGPYRSEFFTTPFQKSESLGSLPWLDLLSIHEYRHALQFSNFKRGITQLGYLLSGESFWAIALNLTIPDWFLEGDAVLAETALSNQGRGRIPTFNQAYRSILTSRDPYTYQKVRNGSFRHDVPDQYQLGYLLTSYGREEYGDSLWMNVMDRTARFKGIIYPFSKAIRHYTGLKSREFYKQAFLDFQSEWQDDLANKITDTSIELTEPVRTVTKYSYSKWDSRTGNWLAVKSSFKRTAAIYEIDQNLGEKKIVDIGINLDTYYSSSERFLVWAEITGDPRFSTKSYSDLVLYDRDQKRKRFLTSGQRLFSPALSPDEKSVLSVRVDHDGKINLVIMDISTGQITKTVPNPENLYFTYPIWKGDGLSIITAARTADGLMTILEIDGNSGDYKELINASNNIIGTTFLSDKTLFYSASNNGNEDIYSIDLKTKELNKWTQSDFGASQPSVNPITNTLCYSEYRHTGKQLRILKLDQPFPASAFPIDLHQLENYKSGFIDIEGGEILTKISDEEHSIKTYNPLMHAFKIHSWTPMATTSSIGLSVVSDNVLNNMHFDAGYNYYFNERSSGYGFSAIYGQYLPLVSLKFSQGYRDQDFFDQNEERVWVRKIGIAVDVPLDFSQGMFYRTVQGGISIDNTYVPDGSGSSESNRNAFHFTTLGFESSFSLTKISAYQNITTPLGLAGEFSFNRSLSAIKASQFQLFLDGAIRGFLPNHNFVVDFSFKHENRWNDYNYLDLNTYPRGYDLSNRGNWIGTWQFNYHFPLMYPDIGFAGLMYLKRIRGNFFLDFGAGDTIHPNGNSEYTIFQSIGAELILDLNLINLLPISAGFRISALGTSDPYNPGRSSYFEVFLPVLRL